METVNFPFQRQLVLIRHGGMLPRFHVSMALFIFLSMLGGFYFELPKYVLHPKVHFPGILAVHSLVFCSWMLLYLAQTLLVQARNIRWHRRLGWVGLGLAIIMPPLGVATAIVMRRFDLTVFHSHNVQHDLAFLAAPLADILAFTPCAWLGIIWRKRPEYHRRLMFLALASIAEAGFGRLPIPGASTWFFLSNLMLYGAAVGHDVWTRGRVHPVFVWAVPLILLDEGVAMYLWLAHPAWWLAICSSLTGIGAG